MKTPTLAFALLPAALAGLVILGGCAVPERSRALGDPTVAGATLADQVCSNCHGRHGISVSPNFPILAAQQQVYLAAELTSFRGRHRHDPAGFEYMWGISRSLSDAQIEQLADYYAHQPPVTPAYPVAPEAVEPGRKLFTQGIPDHNIPACQTCHGDHGEGNGSFPRLAGQHADYVVKQLGIFRRGADERPLGSVMTVIGHGLTQADAVAVAAYIESL